MFIKKNPIPKHNDQRSFTRFAFLPVAVFDGYVWLEVYLRTEYFREKEFKNGPFCYIRPGWNFLRAERIIKK